MNKLFTTLLTSLFCLFSVSLFAQSSISGKVLDGQNEPVIGATVVIEGTSKGAITNLNGEYTIGNVASGSYRVKISSTGLETITKEITVSGATTLDAVLQEDALSMSEVVVTGTFDKRSKLESSVAITTLNPRNIEIRQPRGTGDLLQSVPGIFVDNSAGEVGNRVVARGVTPVGNDQIGFTHISLQEEGLPVMGAQMGFAVVDMFHRADITTGRMEAIRGGSSSITASNSPGGIFNFISKTGGPEFAGSVRVQGGLYGNEKGMGRIEGEFGGPLGKGWGYHLGGFYRHDGGARTTPFPANLGGQFKANITKQFNKSFLKIYGKFLNDQNTFFKEIGLQNDLSRGYQGGTDPIDINYSTTFVDLTSTVVRADQFRREDAPGASQTRIFNAKNGIQNKSWAIGLDYQIDLGKGWNIGIKGKNATFDQDYIQYQGNIVIPVVPSVAVPNNLGYLQFGAATFISPATFAATGPAASQISGSFVPGALSPSYFDAKTGELLAKVNFQLVNGVPSGVLDPNVPNKLGNFLLATAPLNMFNQIRDNIGAININKEAGKHQISFGGFYSSTEINTQWFVDGVTSTIGANPRPVRISYPGPATPPAAVSGSPQLTALFGGLYGNNTFNATDPNGMILHSGLAYTVTRNRSNLGAVYLNDVWKVSKKFTLDIGARFESVRQTGEKEGWQGGSAIGGLGGLDRNPFTTFDLGTRLYNGRVFEYDKSYDATGNVTKEDASGDGEGFQFSYLSWSVGGNYKISDKSAAYLRVSRGNKAPELDYYANNFVNIPLDKKGSVETITQAELGYKLSSKKASLFVTGFYSYLDNALLQLFISNGAQSFFTDPTFNATRTIGVEIENNLNFNKLSIRTQATIQNAVYARLTYQNVAGSVDPARFFNEDFSGNKVKDVPAVMLDITPSYKIGKFSPYLNYRWFSERQGNRRNSVTLDAYGVLGAGIMGDLTSRLTVSVQASNVLNSSGILLFGGYGLQGTTGEDIAVGGVKRPDGTVLPATDITVLNQLNSPVFARPILPRMIVASVTYKL